MLSCAALRAESRIVLLAAPPFLLSGAAAIVFEVAWQRLLVLPSGIGTFSVSVVVAAFMAGLGIGSLLGSCPARASSPAPRCAASRWWLPWR
jgi:predicted membrane-bound spermidine synthase